MNAIVFNKKYFTHTIALDQQARVVVLLIYFEIVKT